ncbi:MAG: Hpt domain-containing protein, partial [Planctomycetota bacterium]
IEEVVGRWRAPHLPAGDAGRDAPPEETGSVLDLAGALERVGGDEGLLREMAELFLAECPALVSRVRQALADLDAEAVAAAAHSLTGSVGSFGARAACDSALAVEAAAREGNLRAAQEAFSDLAVEVSRLVPALTALIEDAAGGARAPQPHPGPFPPA